MLASLRGNISSRIWTESCCWHAKVHKTLNRISFWSYFLPNFYDMQTIIYLYYCKHQLPKFPKFFINISFRRLFQHQKQSEWLWCFETRKQRQTCCVLSKLNVEVYLMNELYTSLFSTWWLRIETSVISYLVFGCLLIQNNNHCMKYSFGPLDAISTKKPYRPQLSIPFAFWC